MKIVIPIAAAALAAALFAASAPAQTDDRRTAQIIVYGNDPCPRVTGGDEIVVCARRPESERYRIPEAFREGQRLRDGESWASRAESALEEGDTGIGSCSAVGPAGFTGCWEEMMRQYRQDRRVNPQPRR
ncbi:MAG TPA: hypothetical protein VF582_00790 [Allosphingosinicella sp.]|jgi:hypothetical protein